MATEQDLVEQCRAGDREAQRALYQGTSERIYRVLLKMTGNPDDAFDLAQETYLKAFARIGEFSGRSSIATWIYRIAVNEALQFLRRAARARIKLQRLTPENRIESDTEQSTIRSDVTEALAALPPTDRAMLLLRYQEGLDYGALADVVGCAAGTVASRLNRARNKMRDYLRKSYAQREENDPAGHPRDSEEVSKHPSRGL